MTTVYAKVQMRRDTAANWAAANPVLAEGEVGYITDTKAEKIGDGVTAWNDLLSRPSLEQLTDVQTAAETAASDADQRLTATVAAQTATETARDETQTLRDQTYTYKQDAASAIVYQDLASIAEQKALTMVAGCVYDTRLDTDGGAWRDRCQGTSWFNEPLNTTTRGSRRDFPTVAVIIAEAGKVTIFDGDDPSLPMWMVFDTTTNSGFPSTGPYISCVAALNGVLCFGKNNNSSFYEARFIADAGYLYTNNARSRFKGNLSQRGSAIAYSEQVSSLAIVNTTVNDLAMTVLPDAPVDPATGLQVPTIAVATAGGVSVINNDGTVADSSTGLSCDAIQFADDSGLYSHHNGRLFFADDYSADGFGVQIARTSRGTDLYDLLSVPRHIETMGEILAMGGDGAVDAVPGLMLHVPNYADQSKGMSALLTSTFISGWLPGYIRGAFLASTDQTDLVASGELVANGDFASNDLTAWTATAGADASTGQLTITANGATAETADQPISTVAGARYRISINKVSGAGINTDLYVRVGTSVGGYDLVNASAIGTAVAGIYSWEFVATGATANIRVMNNSSTAGRTVTVDDISVELADDDRSVKGNGLIVHGTVPRTPVATGAELVGYSGFSTANYLEQPYNPDLDFGTGDFCVMGWRKGLFANSNVFVMRDAAGVTGKRFGIYMNSGNYSAFVDTKFCTGPGGYFSNSLWDHIVFIRESNVLYLYVNGVQVASLAVASIDVTNTDATLKFGCQDGGAQADTQGSLALWRIGATVPSAAQIAKIYRDEKRLFQPGAQCTLYGTSDSVTALAHDPVTGLLHAGTSAGRSDFDGLARVGNTTTPVASAIAASGGMILEG